MHLCTYAPMHLCTYAPMHLCTYAPMHLCTYAPMSLYSYERMRWRCRDFISPCHYNIMTAGCHGIVKSCDQALMPEFAHECMPP